MRWLNLSKIVFPLLVCSFSVLPALPYVPNSQIEKIRSENCIGSAYQYISTLNFLKQVAPWAIPQFNKIYIINKEYFEALGIRSPLELAKAIAQVEESLFGSKMSVSGNALSASVTYKRILEWEAVEERGNLQPLDNFAIARDFTDAMKDIGQDYGYTTTVALRASGLTVTFTSTKAIEKQCSSGKKSRLAYCPVVGGGKKLPHAM